MCIVHVHCTGNIQTVHYALAMIATVLSVCLQFVHFSFGGLVHVVDNSIHILPSKYPSPWKCPPLIFDVPMVHVCMRYTYKCVSTLHRFLAREF